MAKRYYNRNKKGYYGRKNKKKSKYSELEKLAYNMGKVNRGRQGDTLVNDSYKAGLAGPAEKQPKKKLY